MTRDDLASALRDRLEAHPRLRLAHLPTPLEPMARLSAHLGGPRLYVKRDDCTGLGLGGNKIRKLEFDLAAALSSASSSIETPAFTRRTFAWESTSLLKGMSREGASLIFWEVAMVFTP